MMNSSKAGVSEWMTDTIVNQDSLLNSAASAVPVATDTLTESYTGEWQALEQMEESSGFIQWMASNDLIFVVLGVSLLIWFVLLFFMIRTDRKLTHLENTLKNQSQESTDP